MFLWTWITIDGYIIGYLECVTLNLTPFNIKLLSLFTIILKLIHTAFTFLFDMICMSLIY